MLLFGSLQHLANPVSKQIPQFLPTGCKTWENEATHLSGQLPGHLTTAQAEGWMLMKRPVYVFSAHGPNYWCLCTNPCSAGKPGGEAGHTCPSAWDPAQSTGRGWQHEELPVPRCARLCPPPRAPRPCCPAGTHPEPARGSCQASSPGFGESSGCKGFAWARNVLIKAGFLATAVLEPAAPWLPSKEVVAPMAKVHSSINAYNIWHLLGPWLSAPRFWAV